MGYLTIAASCVVVARSRREDAETRGFIDLVFSWRPGFPLVVLGLVTGLFSLALTTWFSPQNKDDHYADLSSRFSGSSINGLTAAYVTWLGTAALRGHAAARGSGDLPAAPRPGLGGAGPRRWSPSCSRC